MAGFHLTFRIYSFYLQLSTLWWGLSQSSGLWLERSWWGSQSAATSHPNTPKLHHLYLCPGCSPCPSQKHVTWPAETHPPLYLTLLPTAAHMPILFTHSQSCIYLSASLGAHVPGSGPGLVGSTVNLTHGPCSGGGDQSAVTY